MPLWLPTLSVIFLMAIALTWASSPPITTQGRRLWMMGILIFGSLAIAGTVRQQRAVVDEAMAVAGTTTAPQGGRHERNKPDVAALTKQVEALENRVRLLQQHREARAIPHDAADNLARYLKQFGSRRVVVSCVPDNTEAYQYATQLVNVLKAADWDAHGPEMTKIFGDIRAQGINIFMNADDHSDTVNILLDGFAKFNIPYQARVTPSQAIPDSETVELFIGQQQSDRVGDSAD